MFSQTRSALPYHTAASRPGGTDATTVWCADRSTIFRLVSCTAAYSVELTWQTPPPRLRVSWPSMKALAGTKPLSTVRGPTRSLKLQRSPGPTTAPSRRCAAMRMFWRWVALRSTRMVV
ncbi:hypothetical protein D3C72_2088790 [compost metagenome]